MSLGARVRTHDVVPATGIITGGGGGGTTGDGTAGGATIFEMTPGKVITISKAWETNISTDWVNDTSYTDPVMGSSDWVECPAGSYEVRLALNPRKLGYAFLPDNYVITYQLRTGHASTGVIFGGANTSWAGTKCWIARQHFSGNTAAATMPGLYTGEMFRADSTQRQLMQKKKQNADNYGYLDRPSADQNPVSGQVYNIRITHQVLSTGDVEITGYIDGVQKLHAIDSGQNLVDGGGAGTISFGGPYNSSRGQYTCGIRVDFTNCAFRYFKVATL